MNTNHTSKKLAFVSILSFSFIAFHTLSQDTIPNGNNGQGNTLWKTNGNIANDNQFIGTKNDKPVIVKSNDIERLRISPGGNVGIGASTPVTKLDVAGQVTLREDVILPGVTFENGISNILFINENGVMKKGDVNSLVKLIYAPETPPGFPCGIGSSMSLNPK